MTKIMKSVLVELEKSHFKTVHHCSNGIEIIIFYNNNVNENEDIILYAISYEPNGCFDEFFGVGALCVKDDIVIFGCQDAIKINKFNIEGLIKNTLHLKSIYPQSFKVEKAEEIIKQFTKKRTAKKFVLI